MPIVWRPQMSVGNNLIDADHRYLFCLVNTVELALRVPDSRDDLVAALEQLVQYTREHFAREEAVQLKIGYPHYGKHHAEHQRIMTTLAEVGSQVDGSRGRGGSGDPPAGQGLVPLLREWILNHVLTTDLRMKPFLERLPRNFAAT